MREVVACLDELTRHQLALLEELGLFEGGHHAADDAGDAAVNLVFQICDHFCPRQSIINSMLPF